MKLKICEAAVQSAIREYLRSLGAFGVRVNGGGMKVGNRFVRFNRADEGSCSDLVYCLRGRFVAVETKRKLTGAQKGTGPPTRAVAGRSLSKKRLAEIEREAKQRAILALLNAYGWGSS